MQQEKQCHLDIINICIILQTHLLLFLILLGLLSNVSGQKGGAKGAMRRGGKGGKGRGGGGSRGGGYQDTGDYNVGGGGGYSGKARPCIGLCYLRYF